MSQSELDEHLGYLRDERKLDAYRRALAEVVRPGDIVLDLGAGSGLLGYLALEAGAGRVIAVDAGDIIAFAEGLAAANGYADRVEHRRKMSTTLVLEQPVDVVVGDQIGGLVHDAGVLGFYADAKARLAAPDARFVPARFTLHLVPVADAEGLPMVTGWQDGGATGLDLSVGADHAHNTEWRVQAGERFTPLGPPQQVAAIDATDDGPIRADASVTIDTPGRLAGWLGFFRAQMSPSVTLTNDPWAPERFDRWCNLLPTAFAAEVAPGDRLDVHLDVRPRLDITTWDTVLSRDGEAVSSAHQSTFYGTFLTRRSAERRVDSRPVPTPQHADLAREVLHLADGQRSVQQMVAALAPAAGDRFVDERHLRAFVQTVLAASDG